VLISLLSIMAAAGVAAADPAPAAPPPPPQDYQIVWPSEGVMQRFRPDFAFEMRAYITCMATPQQTVTDCKVTKTVPNVPKIGVAALRVAALVRLKRPDGWTPGAQPEAIDVVIHWPPH
jgi:hypothetical protein